MFLCEKYGVLNADYVKEIVIKGKEDIELDECEKPVAILAIMSDNEEKILYECDTIAKAEYKLTEFMAFMATRCKNINQSHDMFSFDETFCEDMFEEDGMRQVMENLEKEFPSEN